MGPALLSWNLAGQSWRLVFWVNVPVAGIAAITAARLLPADRGSEEPHDREHVWQIMIDGTPSGSIVNDHAVELPVEPGRHSLRLRSSWRFASPEWSFEAAEGEVVSFTSHAPLIWPQAAPSLVKPDLWITLKPD
jgi:MFS family permease